MNPVWDRIAAEVRLARAVDEALGDDALWREDDERRREEAAAGALEDNGDRFSVAPNPADDAAARAAAWERIRAAARLCGATGEAVRFKDGWPARLSWSEGTETWAMQIGTGSGQAYQDRCWQVFADWAERRAQGLQRAERRAQRAEQAAVVTYRPRGHVVNQTSPRFVVGTPGDADEGVLVTLEGASETVFVRMTAEEALDLAEAIEAVADGAP